MKPWDITDDYVGKIWAEAYHYYKQGESLVLPPELDETAERAQRAAMEPDDRTGFVREFLEILLPSEEEWAKTSFCSRWDFCQDSEKSLRTKCTRRRDFVSNAEIWVECFGKRKEDIQPKDSYAIAAIMKQLPGWEKAEKPVKISGYGLQRGYKRLKL